MKWAPIAVAFVDMATASAPRRVVWDKFEVVLYKNRPSFVIGTNSDELHLCPAGTIGAARHRVRRNDPNWFRPMKRAPWWTAKKRQATVESAATTGGLMMLRRISILGMVLFALLGAPRVSHAGLLEFIWELSGPRLVGSGLGCLYSLKMQKQECRIGGIFLLPESTKAGAHGPFIVLGGSALFSIFRLRNAALRLVRREHGGLRARSAWFQQGRITVELATGPWSRRVLWPSLWRQFQALRQVRGPIIPIEATRGRWILGLKFRIYPNGFTDDEFGFGPRMSFDGRPSSRGAGPSAISGGEATGVCRLGRVCNRERALSAVRGLGQFSPESLAARRPISAT